MIRENDAVVRWLLRGDPGMRWQTMRDLTDEPPWVVERDVRILKWWDGQ